MRSTNSKLRKTNIKLAALTFLLFTSNLMACKSSMEEDLAPADDVSSEAVVSANELGDEQALAGSFHLKDYTFKTVFDFPVGAAVVKERLDEPLYAKTLKKDFSRLSSEGNFKFGTFQPSEGKFVFTKADYIVNFAKQNNMVVHGHCLIWSHDGLQPQWLLNHKGGAKEFERLMKNHITTVMKHFKGKVTSWDVVNEAIADNGTYKNSIWYRKLGPDYVLKAFKFAQEADPSVKLFYNDYGQEYGGKKYRKIMEIVSEAKKRGIRIDGMGFQLHTVLRVNVDLITNALATAAKEGLLCHISEFDVSVKYQQKKTFILTDLLAKAQGDKIKQIVKTYMKTVPKKLQFGITTWGVSDNDSYFNKKYPNRDHDYPLLFDRHYKAKRAYRGFIEAGLGR